MPLDLNHNSGPLLGPSKPQPLDVAEAINSAIDASLAAQEEDASQKPRRIGAAQLGDPCLRKLVYAYNRTPARPPEGRMRRIWARGHAAEARIIGWLRQAGFVVIDRTKGGEQISFSQADGRIAGRIDGVVIGGPAALPYPLLLELKCLNNKSWNDLRKKGLAASKEVYNAQVHLYMGYLDLRHCLFGAENADTEELWWHVIPYDLAEAQRVSDRGVDVVKSADGPLPPRMASNQDFWLCRMCQFAEPCWSAPA